ncbi:MAG: hypothetical protein HOG49_17735 [Candidatus Scalindua sp.]|nr:hypothetical protein [Candidatus Scalindua sp.]
MEQTYKTIIDEMTERVRNNEPVSPASWIEASVRVVLLSEHLDNKLANYEAEMTEIEAAYLKTDMSAAKAKTLAKAEIDYKDYLETKAPDKRIQEWVMLSKKRAVIQEL